MKRKTTLAFFKVFLFTLIVFGNTTYAQQLSQQYTFSINDLEIGTT